MLNVVRLKKRCDRTALNKPRPVDDGEVNDVMAHPLCYSYELELVDFTALNDEVDQSIVGNLDILCCLGLKLDMLRTPLEPVERPLLRQQDR